MQVQVGEQGAALAGVAEVEVSEIDHVSPGREGLLAGLAGEYYFTR
jgi:hypothetical protein